MKLLSKKDIIGKYPKSVEKKILDLENEYTNTVIGTNLLNGETAIGDCDSPIEQLYFLALKNSCIYENIDLTIETQKEIYANGKKYKVDFYITASELFSLVKNDKHTIYSREVNLCVECDGHNFHEKTKEQVSKDKSRERDIMSKGLNLIRFSGSEIYTKSNKCAIQTLKILKNHLDKKDFEVNIF